jgi:antibiotic biosynthesis monooxygenase (ABM) superfamily enzyme
MTPMAVQLQEMDERVTFHQQLGQDTAPVVLINRFNVAPEDAERLVQAWAEDAAFMKQQPGYISTQLHRGIAGSST